MINQNSRQHGFSRRRLVSGIGIGAAGLALGAGASFRAADAQTPEKVTIALDWYPNANHAGLYLAQDHGYFEDAGLDVEIYTPADPATVLQTVGAGRDTFGVTYHSEVLSARSQDVPVVSVSSFVQHPLNCMMVLADSPIQRPGDLKGRSIAIAGLAADDAVLQTMLASDGLTLDDVTAISVGYDLLPAVLSGRADAVLGVYWTHETILAEQQGIPVRYLKVQDWGVPDYYELLLVTGEETLTDREPMVSAMVQAIQRGFNDAMVDQDAAIDVLAAASPDLDIPTEREGLALLAPLWTDNGAVPFGTQTVERWDAYGGWLKDQGILDGGVDISAAWRGDLGVDVIASPAASPVGSPAATPLS